MSKIQKLEERIFYLKMGNKLNFELVRKLEKEIKEIKQETEKLIEKMKTEENQGYIFHLGESLSGADDYDFKFIIKNDLIHENIDFEKVDFEEIKKFIGTKV